MFSNADAYDFIGADGPPQTNYNAAASNMILWLTSCTHSQENSHGPTIYNHLQDSMLQLAYLVTHTILGLLFVSAQYGTLYWDFILHLRLKSWGPLAIHCLPFTQGEQGKCDPFLLQ